jgi:hypothetical protein
VFDEKVLTWCRKLFGDYYARGLWHNELQELDYLDLNEDEYSFTFEMHCARVCERYELKIDYVAMDQVCTWSHY